MNCNFLLTKVIFDWLNSDHFLWWILSKWILEVNYFLQGVNLYVSVMDLPNYSNWWQIEIQTRDYADHS